MKFENVKVVGVKWRGEGRIEGWNSWDDWETSGSFNVENNLQGGVEEN